MGNLINQQQVPEILNLRNDIEKQLQQINKDVKANKPQSPQIVIHDANFNKELSEKIELNQNKILEQQMKMLTKTEKMTAVKEEAFKTYCALSFEQQLYSIIKYGLKDINEVQIVVYSIGFIGDNNNLILRLELKHKNQQVTLHYPTTLKSKFSLLGQTIYPHIKVTILNFDEEDFLQFNFSDKQMQICVDILSDKQVQMYIKSQWSDTFDIEKFRVVGKYRVRSEVFQYCEAKHCTCEKYQH